MSDTGSRYSIYQKLMAYTEHRQTSSGYPTGRYTQPTLLEFSLLLPPSFFHSFPRGDITFVPFAGRPVVDTTK